MREGQASRNTCPSLLLPTHTHTTPPARTLLYTYAYTSTRTLAHMHTHSYSPAHTRITPYTRTHMPQGATGRHKHHAGIRIRELESDARSHSLTPLRIYVCVAYKGLMCPYTHTTSTFGPENKGEGGRTGRRRPRHRLLRQKPCLEVSSDPKLVSGTQKAVFDRAEF